jgi:hypothetical protein
MDGARFLFGLALISLSWRRSRLAQLSKNPHSVFFILLKTLTKQLCII